VRRPGSIATEVHPLSLTPQAREDLVAFLLTLNSPSQAVSMPTLPR
jgi:hypothetical protein